MALYVDIKKDFGSFALRTKFETQRGVTGILGASGCGKSMTLRCIAGIVKPDEGRIELDGTVFFDSEKKINLTPQERRVGLLFQNYALFPNMTVHQNLMMGLKAHEKDKKKAAEAVAKMMRRFRLDGLEKHRPSQLSGGQQQRAALARILLSKPRMLMLDEPFSALDEFLRWNLELELTEVLQEFGGHTLFVSHNRGEIYRVCDTVCVMEHGVSGPLIPVKQLFERPASQAAAHLSGCKNFSRAHSLSAHCASADAHLLFAEDWGVVLESEGEAPDGFAIIGVRSHYIYPVAAAEAASAKNAFPCTILKIIEDVFSIVVMLRPEGRSRSTPIHEGGQAATLQKSPEDACAQAAGSRSNAEDACAQAAGSRSNAIDAEGADPHNSVIRMEVTKELWAEFCEKEAPDRQIWICIHPHDIMLLR